MIRINTIFHSLLILLFVVTGSSSCKKKKDDTSAASNTAPVVSARKTKYEITGNYSGKVTIVYYNQSGVSLSETFVSLPWSKEFEADAGIAYVGLGASTTSTSTLGVTGQTMTAKIFIGDVEKKTVTATADATGHISFSGLIYTF